MKEPTLLRKASAEFIGTFALIFIGCGAIMVGERFPDSIPHHMVPVIFGLVVAAMVYGAGHISGAHLNPAVTLGFAIARHFPPKNVLTYWIAQCSGSLAAIGALHMLLPAGSTYGATVLHLPIGQAFAWEVIITFILMFVVMAVATDTRAVGILAGVAVGATVCVVAFVAGPLTGASMNPARTLAPAIAEGSLDTLWLYMIAPCVGAVLAALFYNWLRK